MSVELMTTSIAFNFIPASLFIFSLVKAIGLEIRNEKTESNKYTSIAAVSLVICLGLHIYFISLASGH